MSLSEIEINKIQLKNYLLLDPKGLDITKYEYPADTEASKRVE